MTTAWSSAPGRATRSAGTPTTAGDLGTATIILNDYDYGRGGATTRALTGDVGAMRTGLIRIVNDEGSWEGRVLRTSNSYRRT